MRRTRWVQVGGGGGLQVEVTRLRLPAHVVPHITVAESLLSTTLTA
jgi:hypothetical protein